MSLSILPYVGSKRTDINSFERYLPSKISTIVEPFGGSGYLSLFLFSKNPKIKCVVNDIDSELINFFQQTQKNPTKIIQGYNVLVRSNPTKIQFQKLIDEYKTGKGTVERKAILYLFYNKYHGIRKGLYPLSKNHNEIDMDKFIIFFDWINKTEFTNDDYSKVMSKYKNVKSSFLFLDPPYFDSFNGYYISNQNGFSNKVIIDNTKLFIDIAEYLHVSKCNVMLIINKNAITEYIYHDNIIAEYDKTYQLTKKETQHLVITNFKMGK